MLVFSSTIIYCMIYVHSTVGHFQLFTLKYSAFERHTGALVVMGRWFVWHYLKAHIIQTSSGLNSSDKGGTTVYQIWEYHQYGNVYADLTDHFARIHIIEICQPYIGKALWVMF